MSLESAMAVLDKATIEMPMNPGVNPDSAKIVENKTADALKDINVNIQLDGLKGEEKKEPPKELEVKKELEAKTTENKDPKEEEKERASQRFALLAKKERQLYQISQQLKAKDQELQPARQAIENFEKFRAEVKTNPMLALKELGITYDDLTKYVLSGKMPEGSSREVQEVREEIQAMRQREEERMKLSQERRKQRAQETAQQTIVAFQNEIRDYVGSNADKYELINLNEANNLVFQQIEAHYNQTGRILSVVEGCDVVERFLEEQVNKNLTAKKLANKTQPVTRQTEPARQRTLNNEMTSSAPSMLPAKTEQDRLRRAMAALDR